jgi:hypothetical protein
MSTREEVIQKIQKLLRLAQSDNIHEAALAAAHAQRLMEEHRIEQASLDYEPDRESEEEVEDFSMKGAPLDAADHSVSAWRGRLGVIVADSQQCKVYYINVGGRKEFHIIGRPTDVEAVRYLYAYLKREIERLCQRDGKGCGMVWRNQFRMGAVDTVTTMLREATDAERTKVVEAVGEERALVVLDRVEQRMVAVHAKAKVVGLKPGTRSNIRESPSAWVLGREAAKSIRLTKARGAIA